MIFVFKSDKKEVSSFANFTQRKYDYDKLEKQLLGWVDDEEIFLFIVVYMFK